MKDSIIVDMKFANYDLIDGSPSEHRHHCLFGTADRQKADEDGLWVPLTAEHHTNGKLAAHKCLVTRRLLEIIAQLAWEKHHIAEKGSTEAEAREAFRTRYRKSYL